MLKHSLLTALLIAAPITAAPAFAQDPSADSVVATVNGHEITLAQMIVMRQSLQPQLIEGMGEQEVWDMMLDQLIQQAAVSDTVTEADMTPALRAHLELQRRNTLANAAIQSVAETEPTEEQVRAAYTEMFADAQPVAEYSAAHILVDTREEAEAIKAALDEGADFAEQAAEHSTDNAGANGGELGWFSAEQVDEPFGAAVSALEAGEVSEPVETRFGWHIIKLNDTRLREVPEFDTIRDQLVQLVRRDLIEAEINRIVDEAAIVPTEGLDPALATRTDLLETE